MKGVCGVVCALGIVLLNSCALITKDTTWSLYSPDHRMRIVLKLVKKPAGQSAEGSLSYYINHGPFTVIEPSQLGIETQSHSFSRGLTFTGVTSKKINISYSLANGKKSEITTSANEKTISFVNAEGMAINVVLRAFNDGIAIRYILPDEGMDEMVVKEHTSFKLPSGKAYMMPYDEPSQWLPAYENYYEEYTIGSVSPKETGWAFPALFKIDNGSRYILLTESGLMDQYCGGRLEADAPDGLYRIRFPEEQDGNGVGDAKPTISKPWISPWRLLIISDKVKDIVESTLVTDLACPPAYKRGEWIKPGRAAWSWWSESDSPRNFNRQRDFIDLAALLGWEYYLIDANWNLEPTKDLIDFINYAKEKNVGILMWYNSGGPNNIVTEAPRDRLYDKERRRKEFAWLHEIGVRGIKVDFWHSDKQHAMKYYIDLLKDANDFELMVNFHGSTIPRGWQRTFPNFLTCEAVRGAECYKFAPEYPEKAPWHNVNLAFTRNVIGPMDYTPVTISNMEYPHITTTAHELALSVIFQSGITHFADKPESYFAQPDYVQNFLKHVPVVWDDIRFIEGEPGDYIVLARRSGDKWYIAGINGKNKAQTVTLSNKDFGSVQFILVDASDKTIIEMPMEKEKQPIDMLPYGGFVAVAAADK